MGSLRNALQLPATYLRIVNNLKKQEGFIKVNLSPVIDPVLLTSDTTVSEKDILKIKKYYGLAVPAILGEAICALRGFNMSETERWISTCQGVITGLFDDFIDDHGKSEDQIVSLVESPESFNITTSNEQLFLDFYIRALKLSDDPENIINQLLLVHKAQIDSKRQTDPLTTSDDIWEITCKKGGESVLFYRTAFDHELEREEKESLYKLGSLMQFENDIFDVYKDSKSNIATIPVRTGDINELKDQYRSLLQKFLDACNKMNYPKKQLRKFLDIVMPVINRGFVCIEHYQKLEMSSEGGFDVGSFSRKELICDMEKVRNILKTMYYQVKNRY